MIQLNATCLYKRLRLPNVRFAFMEQFDKGVYELYAGVSADDFKLIGKVTAKTDNELTEKMHPLITLAQETLCHKD